MSRHGLRHLNWSVHVPIIYVNEIRISNGVTWPNDFIHCGLATPFNPMRRVHQLIVALNILVIDLVW